MPYISLERCAGYLKKMKSTERHEVNRLVSLACLHHFLEPDIDYITEFHFQYCTVVKNFYTVDTTSF